MTHPSQRTLHPTSTGETGNVVVYNIHTNHQRKSPHSWCESRGLCLYPVNGAYLHRCLIFYSLQNMFCLCKSFLRFSWADLVQKWDRAVIKEMSYKEDSQLKNLDFCRVTFQSRLSELLRERSCLRAMWRVTSLTCFFKYASALLSKLRIPYQNLNFEFLSLLSPENNESALATISRGLF